MMSSVGIELFPSEVLAHIFSIYVGSEGHKNLLDNVANVCKRWREAAITPAVWNDVNVHEHLKTSIEDLRGFAERGLLSHTQNLTLIDNQGNLERSEFKAIISKLPRLKMIYVYSLDMGIDASDVADSCPLLEKLHLSNRKVFSIDDCKLNIRKFETRCPRLKELILRNIGIEYDEADYEGFQMLESFTCHGDLTANELRLVAGKSPKLRHLAVWSEALSGVVDLSSEVMEKLECMSNRSQYVSGDVFVNIIRKWRSSLRCVKVLIFDMINECYFGDALRQLVKKDDDDQSSEAPPISSIQLNRVRLNLHDLAHFVRYASNLTHIDIREVYGLPREYRREYTSRESVQGLRRSLVPGHQLLKTDEVPIL